MSLVKLSRRPAFKPATAVQAAISRQFTLTGLLEVITSVDLVAGVGCLAQEADYLSSSASWRLVCYATSLAVGPAIFEQLERHC